MLVIARELLQYEKDYIKYYINIPRLYYKEKNEENFMENEMIEKINEIIFEDIITFVDMVQYSNDLSKQESILINSLTEFQASYISKDIISLSMEFSQLWGFTDISYIKGYNYDIKLRKEIYLNDLFKKNVDFIKLLKKYILTQINKFLYDMQLHEDDILDEINEENIKLEEDNIFYFTHEFLILPFSSCEIHEEILNLIEFKVPFNKIYPYLNEYTIKNIVKKIIL